MDGKSYLQIKDYTPLEVISAFIEVLDHIEDFSKGLENTDNKIEYTAEELKELEDLNFLDFWKPDFRCSLFTWSFSPLDRCSTDCNGEIS
jgi:hypothetical protein